jgi:hypothetical protein
LVMLCATLWKEKRRWTRQTALSASASVSV